MSLFRHEDATAEMDDPDRVADVLFPVMMFWTRSLLTAALVPFDVMPTMVGRGANPDVVEDIGADPPKVTGADGADAIACRAKTGARPRGIMDACMQVNKVQRRHGTDKGSPSILK